MQLPDDDHTGWDKLIAAVVLGDEDAAQRDDDGVQDEQDDAPVRTVDLSSLPGLAALGGGHDATT